MGWLHATPDKASQRRIETISNPELPDVSPCDYMAALMFEIGPVHQSGAVSWSEIEAYSRQTGVKLNPWEAQTLRNMAISYLNEYNSARDVNRVPPFRKEIDRKAVDSAFRNLAKRFKDA